MTEETLIACPKCNAWPMPLKAKSGQVEYVCKKCGHHEARSIKSVRPHTEPAEYASA